jgi:hypothetical protein
MSIEKMSADRNSADDTTGIPDINQEIYLMQFGTLEFPVYCKVTDLHKVFGNFGKASRKFQLKKLPVIFNQNIYSVGQFGGQ